MADGVLVLASAKLFTLTWQKFLDCLPDFLEWLLPLFLGWLEVYYSVVVMLMLLFIFLIVFPDSVGSLFASYFL